MSIFRVADISMDLRMGNNTALYCPIPPNFF